MDKSAPLALAVHPAAVPRRIFAHFLCAQKVGRCPLHSLRQLHVLIAVL